MIHLSITEFTARRRSAAERIEQALRPLVERALDGTVNTDGYAELMAAIAAQWRIAYAEESGTEAPRIPPQFRNDILRTLRITDRTRSDQHTVDRISMWLATAILSHSTVTAADDDDEELFLEWVDMNDNKVRHTHMMASGQQVPIGESFLVGGQRMPYPGYPGVDIALWINCRCTVRPVLASEVLAASSIVSGETYTLATATSTGGMLVDRNGVWHSVPIRPTGETMSAQTPEPECKNIDPVTGECLDEAPTQTAPPMTSGLVPWHGVLAPEGIASGDGRKFAVGSLRVRPLPLPLTWQKTSADGHSGSVTVAKIDRIERVGNEMRATGFMLATPEADEVIGLLAEFGKFGVSVDADDASFEMNEELQEVVFTDARIASASIVAIPAFAEAWVSLGEAPLDFMPETGTVVSEPDALVAAHEFLDVAPGLTEDGPGWLTNPVDTDRLRDYWVRGEGAAKIGWGVPGDFNRCRINLAEYVKPQYLNGYCANRHFDALGVWPGQEATAADTLELAETAPAEALGLVASVGTHAPSEWFVDPKFEIGDGRLVKDKAGNWACPMTITEDGQVFGHIAGWKTCHNNWANQCVTAPHSPSDYAHYRLGEVLTDKGTVPVGSLTIGGGHAGPNLSMRAARQHYDDASAAFADVTVGEDEFGIWFAGWIRPGTSNEMVHAARASKLSGDWRKSPYGLDMIAALAVNTPGFTLPRIAAGVIGGEQMSLVAAGVVATESIGTEGIDLEALGAAVAKHLLEAQARKVQMAELAARVKVG